MQALEGSEREARDSVVRRLAARSLPTPTHSPHARTARAPQQRLQEDLRLLAKSASERERAAREGAEAEAREARAALEAARSEAAAATDAAASTRAEAEDALRGSLAGCERARDAAQAALARAEARLEEAVARAEAAEAREAAARQDGGHRLAAERAEWERLVREERAAFDAHRTQLLEKLRASEVRAGEEVSAARERAAVAEREREREVERLQGAWVRHVSDARRRREGALRGAAASLRPMRECVAELRAQVGLQQQAMGSELVRGLEEAGVGSCARLTTPTPLLPVPRLL